MDLAQIESLIELMKTHGVAELEFEDADIKLALRFGSRAAPAQLHAPAPLAPTTAAAPAPAAGLFVKSPMVGTFYRASRPGAPPFVAVGDRVQTGTPLCIVEAMKLMNEIESDLAGIIEEILVENGQPVQFGQPLFRLRAV
jgi:acetyl-CoA carboxylase biotin carboxyl carrier protein